MGILLPAGQWEMRQHLGKNVAHVVEARRGEARVVIVIVTSLSLSLLFCTVIVLFFAISLSLSSGCVRQRCLLILELGPFFASVPAAAAAAASACVLPLDLLPFETHLAALAHP